MAKRMLVVAAVALVGCGGTSGLTGDIDVALALHGNWAEGDRARLAAFVEGLAPAGYFAGLAPRGLAPRFHVVTGEARLTVDLYSHELGVLDPNRVAWHVGDESSGKLAITVTSEAGYAWETAAYVLTHELVETTSDPWVEDAAREICDPCVFDGYALFQVDGAERRVPKYVSAGGCWPAQ